MPISACILINNWHPKLPETIKACSACCSEVLLGINGNGFDPKNYPELQTFQKLHFVFLEWEGYGVTKNELAQKAVHDWILSLDTDEVPDDQLQKAIAGIDESATNNIYAVKMRHHLGEKPVKHGAWAQGSHKFLRLYHKKHTKWDEQTVHEQLKRRPHSKIITLPGIVNHFTAANFRQVLEKNKHYATLSAEKYHQENKPVFPGKSWLSAAFSFIKNYLFRLGFLDGKTGWQLAKGNFIYTYLKYHLLRKMNSRS